MKELYVSFFFVPTSTTMAAVPDFSSCSWLLVGRQRRVPVVTLIRTDTTFSSTALLSALRPQAHAINPPSTPACSIRTTAGSQRTKWRRAIAIITIQVGVPTPGGMRLQNASDLSARLHVGQRSHIGLARHPALLRRCN